MSFAQSNGPVKLDVPAIQFGENQNYNVISYDVLNTDEYSIMYMQELPATIVGEREFRYLDQTGAYAKETADGLDDFVRNSNRVLFLVRQTFNGNNKPTTKFWVIAVRELQSDMPYTMYYPETFIHPIIADAVPVTHSLKNVDQIPDLTEREFGALVAIGKRKYGFYNYPTSSFTTSTLSIKESIQNMKSGFKELGAAMGKGKLALPKNETIMFKREVVNNIRLAATRVKMKDSAQIKLYISQSSDSEYELIGSKTFLGSANPLRATTMAYDQSLQITGTYGWFVLKYKDENGSNSRVIAAGIDDEGEPHFWTLNVGKNGLNSFAPFFSYTHEDGIYTTSLNRDKIFKPFYQHHLLKKDGSVEKLYPTTDEEVGSEKSEFIKTAQPSVPPTPAGSTLGIAKTNEPVGVYEFFGHRYIFTTNKTSVSTNGVKNTSYGNLSVLHVTDKGKITESYEVLENKSSEIVYPMLLGEYPDKAYFLVNYPIMFKLVVSATKVESEILESETYQLVTQANGDIVTTNNNGIMLLTKSMIGNKYFMEFYPSK